MMELKRENSKLCNILFNIIFYYKTDETIRHATCSGKLKFYPVNRQSRSFLSF